MIRDEQLGDAAAIYKVVRAAFGRTDEANLVNWLRENSESVISLVAVEAGEVVGPGLFSGLAAPFKALGLALLSVVPRHQGRGIGSALIRVGLACAEYEGWRGVFVLGDPRYYERFGFDVALAREFSSPYAGSHFMMRAWDGALLTKSAVVEYAVVE